MCTVTYLPIDEKNFILTSNRDESPLRKTISPQKYQHNNLTLLYPKDEVAGGTWIGVSQKERLICLLNGGFQNHKRAPLYRMSRGLIVHKLLQVEDVYKEIEKFDFTDIEPFTIVLVDWSHAVTAHELVWTGTKKYFKVLEQKPHIWSSATLYTLEEKKLREQWFASWVEKQAKFNTKEILKFHQDKSEVKTVLKINKNNKETISTTCVEKANKDITVMYVDYLNDFDTMIKF